MSTLGKVVKSVIKELPKDVVKDGVNVVREIAKEEVGTAIPKVTKNLIRQEVEEGILKVSEEEAKEAAKTSFAYGTKALKQQKLDINTLKEWAIKTGEKIDSGDLTASQAMKEYDKFLSPSEIRETTKSSFSGTAQVMKEASEDPLTVRLNKILPNIEEYKNKNSFRNYLNVLSNLDNDKMLDDLGLINSNLKSQGLSKTLFEKPMTFLKNIMLLQSPTNRLLDGGANFFQRGVSLLDIKTAEALSGTRAKISKILPQGAVKELLESPGYYNGEAAASLNGTLVAIKDSLVQTSKNVYNFAKNKSTKDWVETPIGRHSRKINAEFQWQRFHELGDVTLPNDIKSTLDFLFMKSGYEMSKGVDVFAGGALRAGDIAQNSLAMATRKAEEIGKSGDKEFINDFSRFLISVDNGDKLPASQVKKYQSYFGNKGLDDIITSISEESSDAAARDTFRKEATTKIGKALSYADKEMTKTNVVGRIYDAYFPLARTGYKILDVAFSNNPIKQVRDIAKYLNIAKKELKETGTTNLRNLDRATAKLITGSAAYAGASMLVYNNILTGKLPTGNEGKQYKDKNIKEYSINIGGYSIPYKRLGATATMLGTIADIMNDWKKFDEEYEDVSTTYGPAERGLDVLGIFIADPLWNVSFGDMINDFQLGKVSKKSLQNYISIFPRIYNNLKKSLGFEPSDFLNEMIVNTGKKISDYKGSFKFRPRLDAFGKKVEDSYKIKQNKVNDEAFNQGAFWSIPGYSANVDGVEIELTGDERYAWREMMNHIHDKETDMYYSVEDKLREIVSGVETTKEGSNYFALDNLQLDDDGMRKEYKKRVLEDIYSDCKNKALETLLEYKDKVVDNPREKEYSKYATDMWNRAKKTKLRMMTVPIMNKNLPPSTKPILK